MVIGHSDKLLLQFSVLTVRVLKKIYYDFTKDQLQTIQWNNTESLAKTESFVYNLW